jgi:tetratricopeptide (TPR) repeat protein
MMSWCSILSLWLGALVLVRADDPPPGRVAASIPASPSGYVGSSSCRECHAHFYQLWAPSHHGLAMQPFTTGFARTNLTPQTADLAIGTNRFRVDLQKGVVQEKGPRGEKQYPIQHAMGGKNVFYFLTPLERGRLQVLPVAYDVRRREWFDMSASAVRHFGAQPDAPLDWRESPYTFNTACFNCHVSQLSNNYDLQTDSYHTTWAEPGINCETCHGPGAAHVRLARATPKDQPFHDLKLIVTSQFTADQMNSLCGSCHAKMYPLTRSFPPGERFFDHFGLTALEDSDFYPDGRDLGENFTFTTWRLSPCLKSGKLDCLHCHTSSGRYRFQGDLANQACLPCHQAQVQHAAAHSHHKRGSLGAQCISCHMPMTEFARMRRSDHSMRPPMPAATIAYGSPNACNLCHSDRDAAWSDRWVRQWQTNDYQQATLERADLIAAARKQDWSKVEEMTRYLTSPAHEEIWTASLLRLLRACPNDAKWQAITACLADPSPLVRAAAIDACADQLRADQLPALVAAADDPIRLVRIRAAAALASLPSTNFGDPEQLKIARATLELEQSLSARPDNAAAHYNLGNLYFERREFTNAIDAFLLADRLQPSVPPLVNASLAYNALGQNEQAERRLRQALQLDPTNAVANLNLGMLLAELDRTAEAEKCFRLAAQSDPKSAAAAYNLGVLIAPQHPEEALSWCRRAVDLRPEVPKYAYTLAYFLAQQHQESKAIEVLVASIRQAPAYADSFALLGKLYEAQNDWANALALYRKASDDDRLPEIERQQFAGKAQQLLTK